MCAEKRAERAVKGVSVLFILPTLYLRRKKIFRSLCGLPGGGEERIAAERVGRVSQTLRTTCSSLVAFPVGVTQAQRARGRPPSAGGYTTDRRKSPLNLTASSDTRPGDDDMFVFRLDFVCSAAARRTKPNPFPP